MCIMKKNISNWGNFPKADSRIYEPDRLEYVESFVAKNHSIIARGNGRCYGDASLSDNVISTLSLNKFIDFDIQNGVLECESGVLLDDILELIVPKGFFLPVTPGTRFITVGGALASDVHGKNHHRDGCFSDWVLSFRLLREDGQILSCEPKGNNAELFWATAGGMGLTGIILSVRFKLITIESSYIRQESIKAKNLDEVFKLFDESQDWPYTVAWIDCLQKGKNLGRSILMRGAHATIQDLSPKQRERPLRIFGKALFSVPIYFPGFVLNPLVVKLFNLLYYFKQLKTKSSFINNYNSFFYPLDSVGAWNKIYGKNGFIQYQFVLPLDVSRQGMQEVLETIAASNQGSFLAVLKLFGKNNPQAYNAFPLEGYTLALDFKRNKILPRLVRDLDAIVAKYGGRIYRAKDSMSDAALTDYLQNTDSERFDSAQNKRIKSQ